ncbi:MAG TPA: hypothetical protein VK718_08745 [Ferruginibacter sp.]|nr:hypothetical protein [Ferruginibacter sp.]
MKGSIKIVLLFALAVSLTMMGCNASRRGCGCAANVRAIGM